MQYWWTLCSLHTPKNIKCSYTWYGGIKHALEDYPIDQSTWIVNDLQLISNRATNRRILNEIKNYLWPSLNNCMKGCNDKFITVLLKYFHDTLTVLLECISIIIYLGDPSSQPSFWKTVKNPRTTNVMTNVNMPLSNSCCILSCNEV